jgi:V/A-type H+-transporting ATPase subunit I
MFLPQNMTKLDVVILKRHVDEVAQEVMDFGEFEIIKHSGTEVRTYSLKKESLEDTTNRFMDYRRRLNTIKSFFGRTTVLPDKKATEYMNEMAIKSVMKEIELEVTKYTHEMESVKKRQTEYLVKLDSYRFFGNLDLDLEKTGEVHNFYMGFGGIPSAQYTTFMDAVSTIPSVVMNVGTISQNNMVFFTVPNTAREQLESILKNVFYQDYGIPTDAKHNIRNRMMKYGFEYSMALDEEILLEKQREKLINRLSETVVRIEASIEYYLNMAKLRGEMVSTNSVVLFSGWIPSDMISGLKNKIEEITEHKCEFLDEDAAVLYMRDGIMPPTRLNNPKPLKPFELLVNMFGTPNYKEFDPTPFAAVSYLIMFGAMFGDVGHGLVLSITGFILLLLKRTGQLASLAAIMVWAGISSAIFGVLYGEVFGKPLIDPPLWISPIHNINTILISAIVFGVAMISFGTILGIINSFRRKDYGMMLFAPNGIAGLVFYWSLLYIGYTLLTGGIMPPFIIYIPIVSGLFIWLDKWLSYKLFHHGEKQNPGLGAIDLFETTLSMLSNTISFVRVGAFALNHGALMSAVFIIANMSDNPFGQAVAILIGNLFIIGFEGLVVGIQALRLEYYEFFMKFFRADGRRFHSLKDFKKD